MDIQNKKFIKNNINNEIDGNMIKKLLEKSLINILNDEHCK